MSGTIPKAWSEAHTHPRCPSSRQELGGGGAGQAEVRMRGTIPAGFPPVQSPQLPKKAGEDEVKHLPCLHASGDPG